MQELRFVRDDSDAASLVLRATDGAEDGSDDFFLPVTSELTEFLGVAVPEAATGAAPESDDSAGSADKADGADGADGAGNDAPVARPVQPVSSPTTGDDEVIPVRERVHLRPKEIQDRIRHGETVEQIVADTGMEDRRVRPFAVPIEMERNRIADMARDAHPVRADGPTDGSLREVLAGAFAARGENLRASDWSAAMDSSDHWIISVSWEKGNRAGATQFVADFRFVPGEDGPDTVEPVNSVASDLIDPRFERPVRTVSPVIPSSRQDAEDTEDTEDTAGGDNDADAPDSDADNAGEPSRPQDAAGPSQDAEETRPDNAPVDLFGRRGHPSSRDGNGDSPKRKRKPVTPHWEDVLLGVRTNPKANGRDKKK